MMITQMRRSRAGLVVGAVVGLIFLSGCARKDGGAPLVWGTSAPPPQQTEEVKPVETTKQTTTGPRAVVVQRGDTLSEIAERHDISTREMIKANGLVAPYKLRIGQSLWVPEARYHTVMKGDTIYSLARGYNLTVSELSQKNDLNSRHTIKVGQKLLLPDDAGEWPSKGIQSDAPAIPTRVAKAEPKRAVSDPQQKPAPARYKSVSTPSTKPTNARLITASIPPTDKSVSGSSKFLWPAAGRVISGFGPKQNGLHNDGINIEVNKGDPVRAAQGGVVTYAGNEIRGYGNLLLIKHDDGYVTAYAHNHRLLVRRGDKVRQGELIAQAGSTGSVTSPQVHFEIRKGRDPQNPNNYLPGA